MNYSKYGVFFSKCFRDGNERIIKQTLGLRNLHKDYKYLDNPHFIKRNKVESFNYLVEKMQHRLASRKQDTLFWAGRATMIKSVISNLLLYTVITFELRKSTCKKIDQLTMKFRWRKHADKDRCYTLISWTIILPTQRTWGYRFQKGSNRATLAKTSWHLSTVDHNSPTSKSFR